MSDTIQIVENNTLLNIIDDQGIETNVIVTNETVNVIEITEQGVAGTSYTLSVDDIDLSGNVALVEGDNISLVVNEETHTVTINSLPIEGYGDKHYVHNQLIASAIWTVNHNLNKYPSVSVVDSAESIVIGDVEYTSLNQLIITFSAEFGGKAYVN